MFFHLGFAVPVGGLGSFLSCVFRFVSCASASVAFAKGSCNVFVSRCINTKLPKLFNSISVSIGTTMTGW